MTNITLQLVVRTNTTRDWVLKRPLSLPVEPFVGLQLDLREGFFIIERVRCAHGEQGWDVQCLAGVIKEDKAEELLEAFGSAWEEVMEE